LSLEKQLLANKTNTRERGLIKVTTEHRGRESWAGGKGWFTEGSHETAQSWCDQLTAPKAKPWAAVASELSLPPRTCVCRLWLARAGHTAELREETMKPERLDLSLLPLLSCPSHLSHLL
jgi:hypothetical protein